MTTAHVDVSVDVSVEHSTELPTIWGNPSELRKAMAIWEELGVRSYADAEFHCTEEVPVWTHPTPKAGKQEVRLTRVIVYGWQST